MRAALWSLVSLGVLSLGCGDDTGVVDDGPTPTSDGSTSGVGASSGGGSTSGVGSSSGGEDSGGSGMLDSGSSSDGSSSSTGPGAECGNDVIEGDEVCDGADLGEQTCMDEGFDGGTLACLPDCSGLDTRGCTAAVCGDGLAEGSELCDMADHGGATCVSEGFDSGTLDCEADCQTFDTAGCGTCGNVIVDGAEVCDDIVLFGEDCLSQGFDSGTLACASDCLTYDTAGCGTCGNDLIDGAEFCDNLVLGGEDCLSQGFDSGSLGCSAGCDATCAFDFSACDFTPQQYDVSAPNVSATTSNYFRSHGYNADGDGLLLDFEVYLGLAAACDLDFYVFEAPGFGGPYTQVVRTTVTSGPGTAYYPANLPGPVPVSNGMYYIVGAAWNCSATYYWDNSGAYSGHDAGIGIYNVSHWDNGYPGASDMYVPPNTGGGGTAYVQRMFYAGL